MTMVKRWLMSAGSVLLFVAPAFAIQPPAGQSEFVPLSSLPPADQLPAAPLLITAYAFVWVALAIYIWSIWARLGRVERELHALQQKSGRGISR